MAVADSSAWWRDYAGQPGPPVLSSMACMALYSPATGTNGSITGHYRASHDGQHWPQPGRPYSSRPHNPVRKITSSASLPSTFKSSSHPSSCRVQKKNNPLSSLLPSFVLASPSSHEPPPSTPSSLCYSALLFGYWVPPVTTANSQGPLIARPLSPCVPGSSFFFDPVRPLYEHESLPQQGKLTRRKQACRHRIHLDTFVGPS